jgi:hypothetical protein
MLIVTNNTSHDLRICKINFFIIIYTIKKTQQITFLLCLFKKNEIEHAMFGDFFPSHYFHLGLLLFLLCFVMFEGFHS